MPTIAAFRPIQILAALYMPVCCLTLFAAAIICGVTANSFHLLVLIVWLFVAVGLAIVYGVADRVSMGRALTLTTVMSWLGFLLALPLIGSLRIQYAPLEFAKFALVFLSPIMLLVGILRHKMKLWVKVLIAAVCSPLVVCLLIMCFVQGIEIMLASVGFWIRPHIETVQVGKYKLEVSNSNGFNGVGSGKLTLVTDVLPGIQHVNDLFIGRWVRDVKPTSDHSFHCKYCDGYVEAMKDYDLETKR